jgi:NTP pyrophosphatase (non-canonical NTP hydrolase)
MKFSIDENELKSLRSLQKKVGEIRKKRGFTQDPERALILLVEEVGEVAQQLKRSWSPNYDTFSNSAIAEELADVLFVLLGLSDLLKIDIAEALKKKTASDSNRTWKSIDKPIKLKS